MKRSLILRAPIIKVILSLILLSNPAIAMAHAGHGDDQFHSFYRYFLLRLFHDGLGKQTRSPELEQLLGNIPYL